MKIVIQNVGECYSFKRTHLWTNFVECVMNSHPLLIHPVFGFP